MKLKIFVFIFIGLFGCIQSKAGDIDLIKTPGNTINDVMGSVVDAGTKKPLKEVTVTAYLVSKKEKFVLTDEFGKFGFDELKTGTYKLVFEKEGYRKITKEKVAIKADESFQMRIEMLEDIDFDMMPSPYHFIDSN